MTVDYWYTQDPDIEGVYTLDAMKQVYKYAVNHQEYPNFDEWLFDMERMRIYRRIIVNESTIPMLPIDYSNEITDRIDSASEKKTYKVLEKLAQKYNLDIPNFDQFSYAYYDSFAEPIHNLVIELYEQCGLNIRPTNKLDTSKDFIMKLLMRRYDINELAAEILYDETAKRIRENRRSCERHTADVLNEALGLDAGYLKYFW